MWGPSWLLDGEGLPGSLEQTSWGSGCALEGLEPGSRRATAQRTLTSRGRRGGSPWPPGLCGGRTVGDWGGRPQKTVDREQLPGSSTSGYQASTFLSPQRAVLAPCAPGPPSALPLPGEAAWPLLLFHTRRFWPGHRQPSGADTLASGFGSQDCEKLLETQRTGRGWGWMWAWCGACGHRPWGGVRATSPSCLWGSA